MIFLCGVASDRPMEMACARLKQLNARYIFFNQQSFAGTAIRLSMADGSVTGSLSLMDGKYRLSDFHSIYTRLADEDKLPELSRFSPASETYKSCRRLHDILASWMEVAPGLVVNRSAASASNSSKPYQLQLIRQHGFLVPETLITNVPEKVEAFQKRHLRVIFKSSSGVRSIVRKLSKSDFKRLHQIRHCPTQFQAYIEGTNVRVHVIQEEIYATAISTRATDYRYALLETSKPAELRPVRLNDELSEKCIKLTKSLGLVFAGIDLKVSTDNKVFCFEVNPSPGYSFFESHANQPISMALARCLMKADGQTCGSRSTK